MDLNTTPQDGQGQGGNKPASAHVQNLTPDQVSSCCGTPLAVVSACWPLVLQALKDEGIASLMTQVAAAATLAVECAFKPVVERMADPHRQPDLARTQARYAPFFGRGYIQLTWEKNYKTFGDLLSLDLVNHPELAELPQNAARIFALYFKRMSVDRSANRQDWIHVRRLVNGGTNGWDRFHDCVLKLLAEVPDGDPR